MIKKHLHNLIWPLTYLAPFACLCIGYACCSFFFTKQAIKTPNIIGKNIIQATKELSDQKLALRIVAYKECLDIPEHHIINQIPQAGTSLLPQQTILVSISQKADPTKTPPLVGLSMQEAIQQCNEKKISVIHIKVPSSLPQALCIGQIPSANEPLLEKQLILYDSFSEKKWALFPNLQGKRLSEIHEAFNTYDVKITSFHTTQIPHDHVCNCPIIAQKPLAGTYIDLKKHITLQIQFQS